MREIKFRTWANGTMWHVNGLACTDESEKMDLVDDSIGGYDSVYDYDELETRVLMQYTGLKDKNGKEIYEGDILKRTFSKHSDYIGEVVFEDVTYFIKKDNGEDGAEYSFLANQHDFETEILGNIYENPELLQ